MKVLTAGLIEHRSESLRVFRGLGGVHPELVILLLILVAAGGINVAHARHQVMLYAFFLPVILAAHLFGRSRTISAALAVISLGCWLALLRPEAFARPGETMFLWLDLLLWAFFILLTALALGNMHASREHAFVDLRRAYSGVLEIMTKFIGSADEYTKAHSVRVSRVATAIANEMGLEAT